MEPDRRDDRLATEEEEVDDNERKRLGAQYERNLPPISARNGFRRMQHGKEHRFPRGHSIFNADHNPQVPGSLCDAKRPSKIVERGPRNRLMRWASVIWPT